MGISISGLVRKILVPVMEAHGFKLVSQGGDAYFFEKQYRVDGSTACICLANLCTPYRYMKLQIDFSHSYFYQMVNTDDIMIGTESLEKGFLEGWSYKSSEDVKDILGAIVYSMEEKGFEMLDAMGNDPDDVLPTLEDHRDFYENHEKYAEEFRARHRLADWNAKEILNAIHKEVRDIPPRAVLKYRSEIMRIAAVYGELCVIQNGKWEWDDDCTKVVLSGKKGFRLRTDIYPLNCIWRHLLTGKKELLETRIQRELSNAGYL